MSAYFIVQTARLGRRGVLNSPGDVTSGRLGHVSVAFTLDVYGHVLPGQHADAAAAVTVRVDQ